MPVPPAAAYGLYLTVQAPLPTYSTLVDPLNLPTEYYEALIWSLCVRCAPTPNATASREKKALAVPYPDSRDRCGPPLRLKQALMGHR